MEILVVGGLDMFSYTNYNLHVSERDIAEKEETGVVGP